MYPRELPMHSQQPLQQRDKGTRSSCAPLFIVNCTVRNTDENVSISEQIVPSKRGYHTKVSMSTKCLQMGTKN